MKRKVFIASCADDGGIYCFDWEKGKMTLDEVVRLPRPMYMAVENGKMYVICEGDVAGGKEGSLVVFDIERGKLIGKSAAVSTKGLVPCHLCVDNGEIYAVNYASGSVVRLPDGKLVEHEGKGVNPVRQDGAHTHMACLSPDRRRVLVADLGLDAVFVYDRALNLVSKARVPDGFGARHLVFSPDGKYVYCVNELISSVTVFAYMHGTPEYVDTYLCPVDFNGENTAAAIRLNKQGNVLYISNRGENTLVSFDVDGPKLALRQKIDCRGNFPRDFGLTPCGRYIVCCNQYTNNLSIFSVENNYMDYLGTVDNIPNPLCVFFLEADD